jgi:hypothetical protein
MGNFIVIVPSKASLMDSVEGVFGKGSTSLNTLIEHYGYKEKCPDI